MAKLPEGMELVSMHREAVEVPCDCPDGPCAWKHFEPRPYVRAVVHIRPDIIDTTATEWTPADPLTTP